jgi:hypothetical protein
VDQDSRGGTGVLPEYSSEILILVSMATAMHVRLRINSQGMDNMGMIFITLTNDRHAVADFHSVSRDGEVVKALVSQHNT